MLDVLCLALTWGQHHVEAHALRAVMQATGMIDRQSVCHAGSRQSGERHTGAMQSQRRGLYHLLVQPSRVVAVPVRHCLTDLNTLIRRALSLDPRSPELQTCSCCRAPLVTELNATAATDVCKLACYIYTCNCSHAGACMRVHTPGHICQFVDVCMAVSLGVQENMEFETPCTGWTGHCSRPQATGHSVCVVFIPQFHTTNSSWHIQ